VLDPKTGDVIAIGKDPTYDPLTLTTFRKRRKENMAGALLRICRGGHAFDKQAPLTR